MDKNKLTDSAGRPLTQSLFLEVGYTDYAVFTLKDEDYEYKGKKYPSLKRIYLQEEDPTEYEFANKHLLGWNQWKRLCENKLIRKYIDEWREELELKLRSRGIKEAIKNAEGGGFQAAKWLAERGWEQRGAGRPSKDEVERQKKFEARVAEDYSADVVRLYGKEAV